MKARASQSEAVDRASAAETALWTARVAMEKAVELHAQARVARALAARDREVADAEASAPSALSVGERDMAAAEAETLADGLIAAADKRAAAQIDAANCRTRMDWANARVADQELEDLRAVFIAKLSKVRLPLERTS